jgi:hypothetical protein
MNTYEKSCARFHAQESRLWAQDLNISAPLLLAGFGRFYSGRRVEVRLAESAQRPLIGRDDIGNYLLDLLPQDHFLTFLDFVKRGMTKSDIHRHCLIEKKRSIARSDEP